ncbi:MAG: autoinducer synthase [Thalassovita sp.]
MLKYLYADQLHHYPYLRDTMFQDRAFQFKTRLGWDVCVDQHGRERDCYDDVNPLYVIWQDWEGRHGGSMRFLPTTGRCMVNEHFATLIEGGRISAPTIWECTRFCLSQAPRPSVAAALMLGGAEVMEQFGLRQLVGVFDARMQRIYARVGARPKVLGSAGSGRSQINLGLWEFQPDVKAAIAIQAKLSAAQSKMWATRAFAQMSPSEHQMTG